MRKRIFFLLILCLCLSAALPVLAQTFTLDTIHASVDIPDGYTILTPDNMSTQSSFLESRNTTVDVMLQTFQVEGILLQAWGADGDTCLQISALADVDAQTYFDIDQQTTTTRSIYRKEHLDGEAYKALGISYDSAEWKKTTAYGRFLMLKYVQRIGGEVDHRGYARRTIRNGYTITLDYQVYGRGLAARDNSALNNVMESWKFTEVLPITGESAANKAQFTQKPPEETNDASFTVKGTASAGAKIIGTIASMASSNKITVEATASKSGKFTMEATLPSEGVYVMTATVEVDGNVAEELIFPEITYQKDLLPVNFSEEFPAELTTDQLEISGTSMKGVQVQCIVNGENYTKKVGANQAFSFSIDTSTEGTYSFVIAFSKKGFTDRRYSFTATRTWSETEKQDKIRREAIKPAYGTLVSKINGYDGRIMGYTAYVTEITKSGEDWMVYMAFRKTNTGYKDLFVVMTSEEPALMADSQIKMYGQCVGLHTIQDEAGNKEYPAFELLFWDR